jgi:hypothetical protein
LFGLLPEISRVSERQYSAPRIVTAVLLASRNSSLMFGARLAAW